MFGQISYRLSNFFSQLLSYLDGPPGNVLVGVEGELVQVTHQHAQLLLVVRAIELLPQLLHLHPG